MRKGVLRIPRQCRGIPFSLSLLLPYEHDIIFEQAGRGGRFSVFVFYSEHQRREDFMEILNCKKDYLENLIRDLENRHSSNAGNPVAESHLDHVAQLYN
ncbi:MAG: hypothetical protein PHT62_00995 [Desulfotomaculaceae bacterium]|nr:hypothetical protein [Desulfotomaculaceae bacterium]